jgi:hypothetical protein
VFGLLGDQEFWLSAKIFKFVDVRESTEAGARGGVVSQPSTARSLSGRQACAFSFLFYESRKTKKSKQHINVSRGHAREIRKL